MQKTKQFFDILYFIKGKLILVPMFNHQNTILKRRLRACVMPFFAETVGILYIYFVWQNGQNSEICTFILHIS